MAAGGRSPHPHRLSRPAGYPRISSHNATSLRASLVTHRYIYFAGILPDTTLKPQKCGNLNVIRPP